MGGIKQNWHFRDRLWWKFRNPCCDGQIKHFLVKKSLKRIMVSGMTDDIIFQKLHLGAYMILNRCSYLLPVSSRYMRSSEHCRVLRCLHCHLYYFQTCITRHVRYHMIFSFSQFIAYHRDHSLFGCVSWQELFFLPEKSVSAVKLTTVCILCPLL